MNVLFRFVDPESQPSGGYSHLQEGLREWLSTCNASNVFLILYSTYISYFFELNWK